MSGFGQSERSVAFGDMNARVGVVEMEETLAKFGVPTMNSAVEIIVQFSAESGLIMENTWIN